jgi:hypothetical protein
MIRILRKVKITARGFRCFSTAAKNDIEVAPQVEEDNGFNEQLKKHGYDIP